MLRTTVTFFIFHRPDTTGAVFDAIVIFQDFVRCDMRFDENVEVGEIAGVTGYLAEVRDAPADRSGAELFEMQATGYR